MRLTRIAMESVLFISIISQPAFAQTLIRNASIANASIRGGGVPSVVNSAIGVMTPQGGGAFTLTIPSTGSGNLIIVAVSAVNTSDTVSSISDNATAGSNAYSSASVRASDSNSGEEEIWYAANSNSGATTLTIHMTVTGTNPVIWVLEVANMKTSSPAGATASASSQPASATPSAPTVNTTNAHSVVFSVGVVQNNVTGIHAGNVFTGMTISSGDDSAYYFSNSTGTYGAQWNQNVSGTYCASTVEFFPAH